MTRMTRQKEFELQAAQVRQSWERERTTRRRMMQAYYSGCEHASNTLSPQEDVVEKRRTKHVVLSEARPLSTRTLLMENILLLIVLGLSIFGLYMLSIYLMNQSGY